MFRENVIYCIRVKIKNDVCVFVKLELLLEGEIKNEIGESFGFVELFFIIKSRGLFIVEFLVNKKNGKVWMSVINMNRKDVILNRDMLVVSFSIVDCIKEKLNFLNKFRY